MINPEYYSSNADDDTLMAEAALQEFYSRHENNLDEVSEEELVIASLTHALLALGHRVKDLPSGIEDIGR